MRLIQPDCTDVEKASFNTGDEGFLLFKEDG
jgi:hypothetical protein